jgi:hypothetical protein
MQDAWRQQEVYAMIHRFFLALAQKEKRALPGTQVDVQYVVVKLYPNQFSERNNESPFGFAEYLEFPTLRLRL